MTLLFFIFAFYYVQYARLIDRKLASGPFSDSVNIYAAPRTIGLGDAWTVEELAPGLRQSGYGTSRGNRTGWYNLRPGAMEIFPGKDSYTGSEPAVISFAHGKIARILSLEDNTERREYRLEPQLITNISDRHREKRRLVQFAEIPPALVRAVVSAEDKRFFQHSGFDVFRILKAAYVDLKEGRKEQGASTLSMQLVRSLWLGPDKSWRRKIAELLMTLHLEEKLSKEKIFENYANQVYLGRRGTFSINGFGEGARDYFGKDIGQFTIPEAAMLAGLVQRPSHYNPFRYPERARERRNTVLGLMRQNGYITESEYRDYAASPLRLSREPADSEEAQYFIDLVNEELQDRFQDEGKPTPHVYTTLDPELQKAAQDAVRIGMPGVDALLKKRRAAHGQPQVALIALDPHTGNIKALVGGRDYSDSQLNHVLAMRQPGSVFKPFVYAAAVDTAVEGGPKIFTPATVVLDAATTFQFGHISYQPGNFHNSYLGSVTLRDALAHSANVATIKVAEIAGYDAVVNIARRAGFNGRIKPTPAVALGAYETTPLELAGAYTVLANQGVYVRPVLVSLVRSGRGAIMYQQAPDRRQALDPRVAYLMVNMLEEVMRSGTAAGVRSRGFKAPAAGKTGTSRDGWFAGFTSELLCIVWVGFDDNHDLGLEGSKSALPIWTGFMKRALELRQYRDVKPFPRPGGIASETVCLQSGEIATPYCPRTRPEVFVDGSQPVAECHLHPAFEAALDGTGEQRSGEADRITLAPLDELPSPPALPPSPAKPPRRPDR